MATDMIDIPQNMKYTPIGVEGIVEVNAHLVGGSLIDSLRKTFTIGSQLEQGDYFMDRSLDLLEKHLKLMLLSEQITIQRGYMKLVFNSLYYSAESDSDLPGRGTSNTSYTRTTTMAPRSKGSFKPESISVSLGKRIRLSR